MSPRIGRREFTGLLGGAAALTWTWPVAVRAQQPPLPKIGWVSGRANAEQAADILGAFRKGLDEGGFTEGKNVTIDYRWAQSDNSRFPTLIADLIRGGVAVLVTGGNTAATVSAKSQTSTIPIVFSTAADPIELGLVASLNRPGGNLTGVTTFGGDLGSKRLELVRELLPKATSAAFLINPTNPSSTAILRNAKAAAATLGLNISVLEASSVAEFDGIFASLARSRTDAIVIGADGLFTTYDQRLGELSRRYAIPTVYQNPEFAAAGGLMSYGGDYVGGLRTVGIYAGRILKGERAADLPVQQATKVELIINLKTAKALGITFPITLLGRADEVIE